MLIGKTAVVAFLQVIDSCPAECRGLYHLIGSAGSTRIVAFPHQDTCLKTLHGIVVEVELTVEEITVVHHLRNLTACYDGVMVFQKGLSGKHVLQDSLRRLAHRELWRYAIG